ncbi:hypothetical protein MXB_174 [Myxobolus squamalis]|nr:hypothetical protein MXB_174 [Myxobolus squamalis]
MKCMNLDRIDKFPFPTLPYPIDVKNAEETLLILGAIETACTSIGMNTRVTKLGRQINCIPLLPRYSKMIIESISHGCAPYVIIIAAALSVRELFIDDLSLRSMNVTVIEERFLTALVHVINQMTLFPSAISMGSDVRLLRKYENCISISTVKVAFFTTNSVLKMFNCKIADIYTLSQPSDSEVETIRKILTACFKDQIARKIPKTSINYDKKITLYEVIKTINLLCKNIDSPLIIHQNSSCRHRDLEVLLFNELLEGNNLSMKGICEVEEDWAYS